MDWLYFHVEFELLIGETVKVMTYINGNLKIIAILWPNVCLKCFSYRLQSLIEFLSHGFFNTFLNIKKCKWHKKWGYLEPKWG